MRFFINFVHPLGEPMIPPLLCWKGFAVPPGRDSFTLPPSLRGFLDFRSIRVPDYGILGDRSFQSLSGTLMN
jgi:hypothetical protein